MSVLQQKGSVVAVHFFVFMDFQLFGMINCIEEYSFIDRFRNSMKLHTFSAIKFLELLNTYCSDC